MREALPLVLTGMAGAGLGGLFFGGLWWTVRRGVSSKRPARWFCGSLVLRMSIAVAGFYLVGGGQWERFVACGLGFALARCLATRLTGPPVVHYRSPVKVTGHAS